MRISSPKIRTLFLTGFLALALIGLAACDSGNDDDNGEVVEGVYTFTELRFNVEAPTVDDAEVLDSLVTAETYVQFFASDDAVNVTLPYVFIDGRQGVYVGNYSASGGEVTVDFDGDPSRLLLPDPLTLTVEGDGSVLSAEHEMEIDLSTFSDAYQDGVEYEGTLQVELQQQ